MRSPCGQASHALRLVTASLRSREGDDRARATLANSPATTAAQNHNGTAGRNGKGEQRCESGKLRELSPDGYGAQPADNAQFDQTAGHAREDGGQAHA